jgi:hypothetical protein
MDSSKRRPLPTHLNPLYVPVRDIGRFQRVSTWSVTIAEAIEALKELELPEEAHEQIWRIFDAAMRMNYEIQYKYGWREYPVEPPTLFDWNPVWGQSFDEGLRKLLDDSGE